jgi:hypothetical protein
LIHSGIIFVFIEGKYIVDVFDKWSNWDGFNSYVCFIWCCEVFTVFLNKEIVIVDEESIEFTEVLLFGHFVFYYS